MILALLACSTPAPEIQVPGVRATVPAATEPLSPAARDSLTAGTLRQDPDADVVVDAVGPKGKPDELLYAVMRIHRSPGMAGGLSVEEWTKVNVQALKDHTKSRGVEAKHQVSCADDVCLFEYSMGGSMFHRSRLSRDGSRLLTESCQCTQADCLSACSLPAPKGSAER